MTLKGHWVLSEDSGSTAYDYSGNENHGSITGAGPAGTGTVTGPFGNSTYSFDGSDDYIDVGTIDFTGKKYFTFAAWVYWNGDTSSSDVIHSENYEVILSKSTDSPVEITFWDSNSNKYSAVAPSTPPTNTWTHYVGAYDSTKVMLYENGQIVKSTSASGTVRDRSSSTTTIGAKSSKDARFWPGALNDIRLYNRALTPQEVQYLYQAGKQSEATFGGQKR